MTYRGTLIPLAFVVAVGYALITSILFVTSEYGTIEWLASLVTVVTGQIIVIVAGVGYAVVKRVELLLEEADDA